MHENTLSTFFELISQRRSVRAFHTQPIETEKERAIFQAVQAAPSAGNLQAFEVYLVRQTSTKKALAEAAWNQVFMVEAPLILVFCAHPARCTWKYGRRGEELYAVQDATIACTFAMLAATQLGLGCVWVGAFDEDEVRRVLRIDASLRPVALLPVGYARETPPPRPRRAIEDIVHEIL